MALLISCGSRAFGLALALLLAAWLGAPAVPAQTQADPEREAAPRREVAPVTAVRGMVVAAHPMASAAGLEVLRVGGNAVDALIAAQFVLNVVEPQSSGIGGGGFLLLYLADNREVVTLDGREEAPAATTPDWFLGPDGRPEPFYPDRITGGRAVAVPGLLKMLEKASGLYGRLPLAAVIEPAIRIAEKGFPVSPRLAASLARHRERLASFPAARAFFDASGQPLAAGTLLRQPELAATFRVIAAEGSASFYRGEIARDIVRAVRESPVRPGTMTLEDLAGYEAPLRAPVRGTYRGHTVYGMGPPSSGGPTLIEMLNLLETRADARLAPRSPMLAHGFVQAARLAYADRERYLADADWALVPLEGLLAKDYARRRARTLWWEGPLVPVEAGRPAGAPETAWAVRPLEESPSTTHLVVVDLARNVAAATASIEQAFGSGIVVPGRGFFLNNEMTDFSPLPLDDQGRSVPNRVEGGRQPRRTALDDPQSLGGKRPRSSMAPTLVMKEGQPLLALGSPGGPRIIQYVAWVVLLMLDQGMDVQSAVEFPHLTHLGGHTVIEPAWDDPALAEALRGLGHNVDIAEQISGLHAIWIDPKTGLLHGGADPRREGVAVGY
jgi:gamma-glutamyltranspeptidase/glutathione hydrolase